MKLHTRILYILTLVILGLTGCQKDRIVVDKTELKTNDPQSVDEVRTVFAQTLSKALTNEPLRRYIHARMQEAYDTNYELVYIAEKNKVIYDGKTFADILKSFADASIFERYGEDFFMTLTDVSPLLSITMSQMSGIDINAWDVNQVIPVVPVLNEQNAKWLLFQNGQKQEQPLRFRNDYYDDDYPEFDEPVIGIWEAEGYYLVRMDGTTSWGTSIEDYMPGIEGQKSICLPNLQAELSALIPHTLLGRNGYYLIHHNTLVELYNNCLGLSILEEENGGGGNPCPEQCERDCETRDETLVEFKINGSSVFNNINNQHPKFESGFVFHADLVGIVRNSLDGGIGVYTLKMVTKQYKKRDLLDCPLIGPCRGRWIRVNYRIGPDWDQRTFGSPYKIAWAEVDPGSSTQSYQTGIGATFKLDSLGQISVTSSTTISYTGSMIVLLGEQNVYYCDRIMADNSTNSITFRCN